MSAMTDRRESIGELISQLAGQSATLVRDEVALAKREVGEKAAAVGADVAIIAVGAVVAFAAILSMCAALIIALSASIGAWQAALAVGVGLTLIATVLVAIGVRRLKREELKPKRTIKEIEENKEWLKRLT
jgi:uncharacterized membrane protein YqjE